MVGAKINSKMMPIISQLHNGDIIEIVTSDQAKGPSRDWLKFVKSSSAKNKIKGWFKKNQREENIEKGKDLIEKEVKRLSLNQVKLFKPEFINAALNRYKYNSIDDMYASVGFGAMSAGKIIARMLEEYRKENDEENLEAKLEELSKQKIIHSKPSSSGIVVKGIDNCLVRLSKCCNPVPGDEIVGFITRGRGVSVHRRDCVNMNDLLSQSGRMIDVYWYNEQNSSYSVDIEIFSNDRNGLLSDIIKEIGNSKCNLLAVNSKSNKEKIVITEITIKVENLEELNKILKTLRRIDSVYEVKRKK